MSVTSLQGLLSVLCLQLVIVRCQAPPCRDITNQTCTSCVSQPLQLQCGPGDVITGFVQAGFRKSSLSKPSCEYQPGDCLAEPSPLFVNIFSCLWSRQHCNFTLQPHHTPRYGRCNPQPEYRPAYLTASQVQCVSEDLLHHLCNTDHQVICVNLQTSGYILSPNFPEPYAKQMHRNTRDCTITIATAQGLGIQLQSAYMDIRKSKSSCESDYIQMTWEDEPGVLHDVSHCGRDSLSVRMTSSLVVLTFMFKSSGQTNQGFALNYTAFAIGDSGKQSTTDDTLATKTTAMTSGPETPSGQSNLDLNKIYYIAFILLFMTLLLVISIFGLVLYCMRRSQTAALKRAIAGNQYSAMAYLEVERDGWESSPSEGTYIRESV